MAQNSYVRNPFSVWGEFNPKRVYGRIRFLQSIIENVTERETKAINLVGPRRIGKTTILRYLEHHEGCFVQPKFQDAIGDDYSLSQLLIVYVDLAIDFRRENPLSLLADELYSLIKKRREVDLNRIAREIHLGVRTTELTKSETDNRILHIVQEAAREGIRPIVCLDHVEQTSLLADDSNVEQIQRLAKYGSVVIATRNPLIDLYPDLARSPLVHRLVPKRVNLLDRDAALKLLSISLLSTPPHVYLNDKDKELLVEYVGLHPYLLVRAARQAYEHLLSSSGSVHLTRNYIEVEIAPILEPIFEQLWQESGDQLRAFYQLLKEEGTELDRMAHYSIQQYLQREALVYEEWEGEQTCFRFFSSLFESFIMRKLRGSETIKTYTDSNRILADLGVSSRTKEGRVLLILLENCGQVVSDERILNLVWESYEEKHALDTTIARLRDKLKQHKDEVSGEIVRHRKQGFSFKFIKD